MIGERDEGIGVFESSEKLVEITDAILTSPHFLKRFVSTPVKSLIEGTKRKIEGISEKNDKNRKKNLILGGIIGTGKVKNNQNDFVDLLNQGVITEQEVQEALKIYLNTKTIQLFNKVITGIVKNVRGKTVRLPKYVSELSEDEKNIIAYGLKTKIITGQLATYLSFDKEENVEFYLQNYANIDLLKIYYIDLLLDIKRNV